MFSLKKLFGSGGASQEKFDDLELIHKFSSLLTANLILPKPLIENLDDFIPLRIAGISNESHGSSSLLNRFALRHLGVGILPVKDERSTTANTVIELKPGKPSVRCGYRLHVEENKYIAGKIGRLGEKEIKEELEALRKTLFVQDYYADGASKEDLLETAKLSNRITSIQATLEAQSGNPGAIVDATILITITAEDLPLITLIDTPGMTGADKVSMKLAKSAYKDEAGELIPNTVILVTVPAADSINNTTAFEMVIKDNDTTPGIAERTMLVLTKVDRASLEVIAHKLGMSKSFMLIDKMRTFTKNSLGIVAVQNQYFGDIEALMGDGSLVGLEDEATNLEEKWFALRLDSLFTPKALLPMFGAKGASAAEKAEFITNIKTQLGLRNLLSRLGQPSLPIVQQNCVILAKALRDGRKKYDAYVKTIPMSPDMLLKEDSLFSAETNVADRPLRLLESLMHRTFSNFKAAVNHHVKNNDRKLLNGEVAGVFTEVQTTNDNFQIEFASLDESPCDQHALRLTYRDTLFKLLVKDINLTCNSVGDILRGVIEEDGVKPLVLKRFSNLKNACVKFITAKIQEEFSGKTLTAVHSTVTGIVFNSNARHANAQLMSNEMAFETVVNCSFEHVITPILTLLNEGGAMNALLANEGIEKLLREDDLVTDDRFGAIRFSASCLRALDDLKKAFPEDVPEEVAAPEEEVPAAEENNMQVEMEQAVQDLNLTGGGNDAAMKDITDSPPPAQSPRAPAFSPTEHGEGFFAINGGALPQKPNSPPPYSAAKSPAFEFRSAGRGDRGVDDNAMNETMYESAEEGPGHINRRSFMKGGVLHRAHVGPLLTRQGLKAPGGDTNSEEEEEEEEDEENGNSGSNESEEVHASRAPKRERDPSLTPSNDTRDGGNESSEGMDSDLVRALTAGGQGGTHGSESEELGSSAEDNNAEWSDEHGRSAQAKQLPSMEPRPSARSNTRGPRSVPQPKKKQRVDPEAKAEAKSGRKGARAPAPGGEKVRTRGGDGRTRGGERKAKTQPPLQKEGSKEEPLDVCSD